MDLRCRLEKLSYTTYSALGSILPEILAPSLKLVGQKFELIIDEWKFVGHPYTISALLPGSVNATIVFNVVFVLEVRELAHDALF